MLATACRIPIKGALEFLSDCMTAESIEEVIERCLRLSDEHSGDLSGGPAGLADRSVSWLRQDEEEPEFAPLTDMFEEMVNASLSESGPSVELFLANVATRYLQATRYLLPLLHHFARAIAFLARDQRRSSISLFLRDAFFFWPPLAAHAGLPLPPIHLVRYTREEQRSGSPPHVMVETEPGRFRTQSIPNFENTLAADVGLYGTLISALFTRRYCSRDVGVLFMVTRNPHLAGWLNFQLGASLFQGRPVRFPDIVNVADTIESLFKPFQMPTETNGDPDSCIDLSEIVTLCASAAFIWAVHRHSKAEWLQAETTVADCLKDLVEAKTQDRRWYMRVPVTPWPAGPAFLKRWSHGFISPMDNIWCTRF